jgi:hypothetical protein
MAVTRAGTGFENARQRTGLLSERFKHPTRRKKSGSARKRTFAEQIDSG